MQPRIPQSAQSPTLFPTALPHGFAPDFCAGCIEQWWLILLPDALPNHFSRGF